MECKKCGAINPSDNNYCGRCGKPLRSVFGPWFHNGTDDETEPARGWQNFPDNATRFILILLAILGGITWIFAAFNPADSPTQKEPMPTARLRAD